MKRTGSRIGWPSPGRFLLFELAFLTAYYFEAASGHGGIAPFWFSDAVLLCGLLLSPPGEWWFYILAIVPIRLFLFVPPGTALWFTFAGYATAALKAVLSAWMLRRLSRDHAWFDNLHEFSKYFLVAVVLAPGFSALAWGVSHAVAGQDFWTGCGIAFFAGAFAGLVVAPFILLVRHYKRFSIANPSSIEALLLAAGLISTTYIAFRDGSAGAGSPLFLLYLPVPFLLWAGMRFGPVGASASLLLMSVLYAQSHAAELLSTQLSLFFLSVPLMLASVMTSQQSRELKDGEERFRSLVNIAPAMLWMSGADARSTFFNKSWQDFTRLSLKQLTEQEWVVYIHPEDRERCVTQYLCAFKSRESFTFEYRLLDSEGTYRWVRHSGVPRYANDGTFLGYIGSRVDFTDQRQAETDLRRLSTRLVNAHEIDSFRIGYELQDDLAQKLCALSIGFSCLSRENGKNGKLASGLDELQERLRDICGDVVRLSRQLRPATVEGLGLSTALRNLCRQAKGHGRSVLFVQDEDMPPLPENVSLPLYRVAQESLRNALTHSGATHINVELRASVTNVSLSVKDDGCGFVVGLQTAPGLGLTGMSERMRSAGGVFSIISNPGEGTTIVATMPLVRSMAFSATA